MTSLVAHRKSVVTPDTAEALRRLEVVGAERGDIRIQFQGVPQNQCSWQGVAEDPGPTALPSQFSMRPTGREVYLSVKLKDEPANPMKELAILWGLAVPLGFMPWTRYPVPGPRTHVFHYFGPWAKIGDFLHGEGRGELAWPSMCAAAQLEVGTWQGPKPTERSIQSHLHRLGIHCGPVDGEIGRRTLNAMQALGLSKMPLTEAAEALAKMKPPEPENSERNIGFFTMEGNYEAFTSGAVQATRTQTGYAVAAEGPGRLILLFGD